MPEKYRLRATMVMEYDANPADYYEAQTAAEMAKIDQVEATEDPTFLFEADHEKYKITIEPVEVVDAQASGEATTE